MWGAQSQPEVLTGYELQALVNNDLQAECKRRGLGVSGNRHALFLRLLTHQDQQQGTDEVRRWRELEHSAVWRGQAAAQAAPPAADADAGAGMGQPHEHQAQEPFIDQEGRVSCLVVAHLHVVLGHVASVCTSCACSPAASCAHRCCARVDGLCALLHCWQHGFGSGNASRYLLSCKADLKTNYGGGCSRGIHM